MSNLYTQIDMLREERDEARRDRDQLALRIARLSEELTEARRSLEHERQQRKTAEHESPQHGSTQSNPAVPR